MGRKELLYPPQAVKNVFTVGAIDNIEVVDLGSQSKTESVLHGTSISIHQLFSSPSQIVKHTADI